MSDDDDPFEAELAFWAQARATWERMSPEEQAEFGGAFLDYEAWLYEQDDTPEHSIEIKPRRQG